MFARNECAWHLDRAALSPRLPNLDPEVVLRYTPIVDRLPRRGEVLEIGRGRIGLAQLTTAPMTTCDLSVPAFVSTEERFVKASGVLLPFRTRSFDVVVAVDVIEHLEDGVRSRFINEAIRVSRDWVFLACPCSRSRHAEELYWRIHQIFRGTGHRWLLEHRERGLPSEKEILDAIPAGWKIRTFGYINVWVWALVRFLVDVVHLHAYPLIRLAHILDFGDTYRTLFILRRGEDGD